MINERLDVTNRVTKVTNIGMTHLEKDQNLNQQGSNNNN